MEKNFDIKYEISHIPFRILGVPVALALFFLRRWIRGAVSTSSSASE